VLVTGGLGFQGAHLVKALLDRGDHVTILSTASQRNRAKFRQLLHGMAMERQVPDRRPARLLSVGGSVGDAEILEKTIPEHDAVIHMAAWASVDASLERPWPAIEVNALGTFALLEACRRFGDQDLRLLVASSCEVYGPTPISKLTGHPLDQGENWPMLPRSPYAASKIAADRFAYAHAVTYGMDITILRPCNVYGPGQFAGAMGAVIPKFTLAALTHQPLVVTGGGQQFREFLHVEDLVRAYLAALDTPRGDPGATFNVGSGEVRTVQELATLVRGLVTGSTSPITHSDARVADVSGFLLNSSLFRRVFDWKPRMSFVDGLVGYVAWATARHRQGESL
jgi:nucleoside-diphosphate-sugar epimerase